MSALTAEELELASSELANGQHQIVLAIENMRCGGCVSTIERNLGKLSGISYVRANLTLKQLTLRWHTASIPPVCETLSKLGFTPRLPSSSVKTEHSQTLRTYIIALAVAGFAAGNVMLLSVSVWSGADEATRILFHWLAALIALPALLWSGQIFFHSAWQALRHGHTNMDVPISIGIIAATGLSLYDTVIGGERTYFEAALMLVFFLLIGRTLDHLTRARARNAVAGLAQLESRGSWVELADGSREYRSREQLKPGDRLLIAAGERIPVDGRIECGHSDMDSSLVTGESTPQAVQPGVELVAGTLNLTAPLTLRASAAAEDSFVAQTRRLMQAAESGRGQYRRIADRAAALYAPLVHTLAALSLAGWYIASDDLYHSASIAIAVLIITCPCALGLAVPMVHVMAARRLFEQGMLLKDGTALERLAQIDTVIFDKTGTLTFNQASLVDNTGFTTDRLALAASLAKHSRHPRAQSLAVAAEQRGLKTQISLADITEIPGCGLQASMDGMSLRLGRSDWALDGADNEDQASLVLVQDQMLLARFSFIDQPRPDAITCLKQLNDYRLELVSGDTPRAVAELARQLSLSDYYAAATPADKVARINQHTEQGRQVLMVGDGINDAPALVAAHASMAPGSAADIGRNAADVVFLRDNLRAVPQALSVARQAHRLVQQNFAIAVIYNLLALPFAVAGYVTPLVAAVAMSSSSLLVVLNALRLSRKSRSLRHSSEPQLKQRPAV